MTEPEWQASMMACSLTPCGGGETQGMDAVFGQRSIQPPQSLKGACMQLWS